METESTKMATHANEVRLSLSIAGLSDRYWSHILDSSPELCTYLGFPGDCTKLDSFSEGVYTSRLVIWQFPHYHNLVVGALPV